MRLIVTGIVCLMSGLCMGQSNKFSFKLGEEYTLPKRSEDLSFFGNPQDGLVNISLKEDQLFVMRFNPKNLGLAGSDELEVPKATRNFENQGIVEMKNNYYWLRSDYSRSSKSEILYYDKIDIKTGKISKANQVLLETEKIAGTTVSYAVNAYRTEDKYQLSFDLEHSKMLVSCRMMPEYRSDKLNYDKIVLNVFDENFNKLWGGEFTMPYTEAIMDNSDFQVDSSGNAYMLAKVYDSEKRREYDKETGEPAYHYEILKFMKGSKKIIKSLVKLEGHFVREAMIVENTDHKIIFTCTYGSRKNGMGVGGIFLASLDSDGKMTKIKNGYYDFTREEMIKYESEKNRKRWENAETLDFNGLRIRKVLVEKDGSLVVCCERYHIEESTYTSSTGRTTVSYTYCYDEIMVTKINGNGELAWVRKIPKHQAGKVGRRGMGFSLWSEGGDYYFLYLDNLKNMDLDINQTPALHMDGAGGQLVATKISSDGKVTKELIFDAKTEKLMIYPADFKKISSNMIVGRAQVSKNIFMPLALTVKD